MTENVHIGTSGWSYDDWVGLFCPAGTPKTVQPVPVYTFVNNRYAGHGPETCRQLRAACEASLRRA